MGLKFQVAVPPPTAGDVVKGELLVKINGGEAIVVATAVDQSMVEDDRFVGPDGATVELAYSLIDDAGNRSIPREFVAQLVDTFAPPQPGELSLTVVGEVDDPQPEPVVDPVVEPVVEPVVDEDLPDLEVNS